METLQVTIVEQCLPLNEADIILGGIFSKLFCDSTCQKEMGISNWFVPREQTSMSKNLILKQRENYGSVPT